MHECTWKDTNDIPDATALVPNFLLETATQRKDCRNPMVFLDEVEFSRAVREKWPWTVECEM